MGGIAGGVRVTSNRIKPFKRDYVSTAQRDGTMQKGGKKSPDSNIDVKQAAKQGRAAARSGDQRFTNPFLYTKARAWTWGWNRVHGACAGCSQCGPSGTGETEALFSTWLVRFQKEHPALLTARQQGRKDK